MLILQYWFCKCACHTYVRTRRYRTHSERSSYKAHPLQNIQKHTHGACKNRNIQTHMGHLIPERKKKKLVFLWLILILSYDNICGIHFPVINKLKWEVRADYNGRAMCFCSAVYQCFIFIYICFFPQMLCFLFFILINLTQKLTTL